MDQRKPSRDERHFVVVVKFATALGLGVMAAFLYSIKQIHPHLRLEFTLGTVLSFLIVAALGWVFIGVLFRNEFAGDDSSQAAVLQKRRVRRWILIFLGAAGLVTAAAFLYSLKDVSAEGRRDVIEGTAIAVAVLTVGGFLIHKAVRFFEEQDKLGLEQQQHQHEEEDEEP